MSKKRFWRWTNPLI